MERFMRRRALMSDYPLTVWEWKCLSALPKDHGTSNVNGTWLTYLKSHWNSSGTPFIFYATLFLLYDDILLKLCMDDMWLH